MNNTGKSPWNYHNCQEEASVAVLQGKVFNIATYSLKESLFYTE